jgi:DNA repair protein RadC
MSDGGNGGAPAADGPLFSTGEIWIPQTEVDKGNRREAERAAEAEALASGRNPFSLSAVAPELPPREPVFAKNDFGEPDAPLGDEPLSRSGEFARPAPARIFFPGSFGYATALAAGIREEEPLFSNIRKKKRFEDARKEFLALDPASAAEADMMRAFASVTLTDPLLGFPDLDGSQTFGPDGGPEDGRVRRNWARMKSYLDGSDPGALLTPEFREWRKLDDAGRWEAARKSAKALKGLGTRKPLPVPVGQPGGMALGPPEYSEEDMKAAVERHELDLIGQQRGLLYGAIVKALPPVARELAQNAVDGREIDRRAWALLDEGDRRKAMAAVRAMKGRVDSNWLAHGLADAAGSAGDALRFAGRVGARALEGRGPYTTSPAYAAREEEARLELDLRELLAAEYKEEALWSEGLRGAVGSLPLMLSMFSPYTAPFAAAAMAEDSYRQLVSLGIDSGTAMGVGLAVGAVSAGIERLQLESLTGGIGATREELKRRALRGFVQTFRTRGFRAGAAAMGREGVVTWAAETAEEVLQQVVQDTAAAALSPEFSASDVIAGALEAARQAAPTTAVFGLSAGLGLGAGARAYLEARYGNGLDTATILTVNAAADRAVREVEKLHIRFGEDGKALPPDRAAAARHVERLRREWVSAPDAAARARVLSEAGLDAEQADALEDLFALEDRAARRNLGMAMRYRAAHLAADISPEALKRFSPAVLEAEALGADETRVTLRLAEGRTAGILVRRGDTTRGADPARFDAEIRQEVGAETWDAMAESERAFFRTKYRGMGFFRLMAPPEIGVPADASGPAASMSLDGVVTIAAPDGESVLGPRMADVGHELFHAATLIARRSGIITDGQVAALRGVFGDPRSEGEMFDEEHAAQAYGDWLAGRLDPRAEESRTVFQALRDFFRMVWEAVTGRPASREAGAATAEDIFERVRSGDLAGLPADSGVETAGSGGTQPDGTPDAPAAPPVPETAGPARPGIGAVKTLEKTGSGAVRKIEAGKEDGTGGTGSPAPLPENDGIKRNAVAPADPANPREWSAVTPQGAVRIRGTWEAAALDDLVTSDDPRYDQSLQPRDRSSIGSRVQIRDIVAGFDASRLFGSAETDGGSPIVGGGGNVVSGNGRVMALRALADAGRWAEYDGPMRAEAARLGVEIPAGRAPLVLVRRVTRIPAGATMQLVAELSNRPRILTRSPSELAEADAKAVRAAGLESVYSPGADGEVLAASNRAFLTAFVRAVGDPGLLDTAGNPTDALEGRVRRAMLALVVGDGPGARETVRTLTESAGALGMAREVGGVMRAAGALARLAAVNPAYDLRADVARALTDYMEFRRSGVPSAKTWLAQGDMFEPPPREAAAVLRVLADRRSSAQDIASFLAAYAAKAERVDTRPPDRFGTPPASKLELLRLAERDSMPKGPDGLMIRKPVLDDEAVGLDAVARFSVNVVPFLDRYGEPATRVEDITDFLDAEDPAQAAFAERLKKAFPENTLNLLDLALDAGLLPEERQRLAATLYPMWTETGFLFPFSGYLSVQGRARAALDALRETGDTPEPEDLWRLCRSLAKTAAEELIYRDGQKHLNMTAVRKDLEGVFEAILSSPELQDDWSGQFATLESDGRVFFSGQLYGRNLLNAKGREAVNRELASVTRYSVADGRVDARRYADALFDVSLAPDASRVRLVPVSALRATKEEPPESVSNAERFMRAAAAGEGARRAPVSVVTSPDGGYDVVDGRATALAAARMGVPAVWADARERTPGGLSANSALFVPNETRGQATRYESLDALYAAAEEAATQLRAALESAAAHGFGLHMRRTLKGRKRAEEKLADYDGDTSKLLDVFGGTLILEPGQRFGNALKAVEASGLEIVRVKNLYLKPPPNGYRDIKVNVRLPNGFTGEVIMIERGVYEEKEASGHDIYKAARSLESATRGLGDGKEKTALLAVCEALDRVSAVRYGVSGEPYAEALSAVRSAHAHASSSLRSSDMSPGLPAQNILQGSDFTRLPSLIDSLTRMSPSPGSVSETTSVSLLTQNAMSTPLSLVDGDSVADAGGKVNSKNSVARAASRYALSVGLPAGGEGERLIARQLEFLFARRYDPDYRRKAAEAALKRKRTIADNAAAGERRRLTAERDAAARAFGSPADPAAWEAAFDAAEDGTVSRVIHGFFMREGLREFPGAYGGRDLFGLKIKTSHDLAALLMPLRNPYCESMKAVYMDGDGRVLGARVCTVGLLDRAPAAPQAIFQRGVELGAAKAAFAHNHPSGNPAPSGGDAAVTEQLTRAGQMLGIDYVDHIITDGDTYYSFADGQTHGFAGERPDWEAYPAGQTPLLNTPKVVASLAGALRQGRGDFVHAVLLDTRNRINAVARIPFQAGRPDAAGIARAVYRAAVANPSGAIILDLTAEGITPDEARSIHRHVEQAGKTVGIGLLDSVFSDADGWARSIQGGGERVMPLAEKAPAQAAAEGAARYSVQSRRLEPLALPDGLAEVSAGTSVSALAQTRFRAEHVRHIEKLTGSEIQAYLLTGGRGPDAAAAFFGGRAGGMGGAGEEGGGALRRAGALPDGLTGARYSVRIGSGEPVDVATTLLAMRIIKGGEVGPQDAEVLARALRLGNAPDDLLERARAVAGGFRARVHGMAMSDPELARAVNAQAVTERYLSMAEDIADLGYAQGRGDTREAERLKRVRERAVAGQVAAQTGIDAESFEAQWGVDFAAALLANEPEPPAPAAEEKEGGPESGGGGAPSPAAADGALPLPPGTDPADWERVQREARADAAAKQARREQDRLRREQAAERWGAEGGSGGGGGEGAAGREPPAPTLAGTGGEVFTIRDPVYFVSLVKRMFVDRMAKGGDEGFDPLNPFKSPVARRAYAMTLRGVLRGLSDALEVSGAREGTRIRLERLREAKRVDHIELEAENIFARIHRQAIKESRESLVSRLEGELAAWAGARGRWTPSAAEADRKAEAAVEKWARTVKSYLRLSGEEVGAEENRLRGILERRAAAAAKDAGGYDVGFDRDYQDAADAMAALTSFGGLVHRMPAEIEDAAAVIMDQVRGSRQRLEARREEERLRRKAIEDALADAVAARGAPFTPEPGGAALFLDSAIGDLHLRLRGLVSSARGEIRRRAEKALDEIEGEIAEASETRETYIRVNREKLRKALKDIYGSVQAGLDRMEEALPREAGDALATDMQHERMTVGRALQLYASVLQKDYRENAVRHGRHRQIPLLEAHLTAKDKALLAWLRRWYRDNRAELDPAVRGITGLPLLSPAETYMPVKIRREQAGLETKGRAWTPLPASLTPRVRHLLDFDTRASILDVFMERLGDSANTVAFARTGSGLAAVFGGTRLQWTMERHHGAEARRRLLAHVTDLLRGDGGADPEARTPIGDAARAWVSRFTLAYNLGSALKQLAAFPCFALRDDVGFGGVVRAMTRYSHDAVRELAASDGFKARYGAGASEEIANAVRAGGRHGLLARAYNWGFRIPQYGDMVAALWIGQGIYRARLSRLLDGGMDAAAAKRRALAETWNIVGATQQSARIEHMPAVLRRGGSLGRLLFQFVTSPAQQLAFEVQAAREALALRGADGSARRLLRVAVINHALVPALMALAGAAWRKLLGYPDDENEERFFEEVLVNFVVGPFSGMFIAGSMGEVGARALLTGKRDWRGHGLPVENIYDVFEAGVLTVRDVATMNTEDIREDLLRFLSMVSAPARHIGQAVKNRSSE